MRLGPDRLVRAGVGLAVLLVLALTVRGWWSDYREAAEQNGRASAETSASAEPTDSPTAAEGEEQPTTPSAEPAATVETVIVLIDGLNFRSAPRDDATPMRGLDKGERLRLLGERDGWYEVRDSDGQTGWVSANPSYTKTERR